MRYWLETLGCPKNQVDSDKLAGTWTPRATAGAGEPEAADLVVVNTCAFIEAARQESIDTILALADVRRAGRPAGGDRLPGRALRRRAGRRLARGRPGGRVRSAGHPGRHPAGSRRSRPSTCSTCPDRRPRAPWAYVKVAEGCDRKCGFCAIPSFRGRQRSRRRATSWPRSSRSASRRSCWSPRTWPPTAGTSAAGTGDRSRSSAEPSVSPG